MLEAVTQPIGVLYGIPHLVVSGNAATTASNILGSADLFRISAAIILAGVFMDLFVAWALFVFFKPANKSLSLLVAIFRLIGAATATIAVGYAIYALQLLEGSPYGNGLSTAQLNSQALLSLGAYDYGYDLGLIFFGTHLLALGYLAFKSGYLSRPWGAVLGVLIFVAGAGYVIDNVGKLLVPGYNVTISSFTFVGELLLAIWLVIWGRKVNIATPSVS